MTFTVEPMINAGKRDIRQLADGWTIVTADHSLSAQWEHTVLVTDEAYEIPHGLGRHSGTARVRGRASLQAPCRCKTRGG
jgi:hypothetical protein